MGTICLGSLIVLFLKAHAAECFVVTARSERALTTAQNDVPAYDSPQDSASEDVRREVGLEREPRNGDESCPAVRCPRDPPMSPVAFTEFGLLTSSN